MNSGRACYQPSRGSLRLGLKEWPEALLSNRFGIGALDSFDSSGATSFGMFAERADGELRFSKDGDIDGYSSFSAIFPADRSSVVVLCNFETDDLVALAYGCTSIANSNANPSGFQLENRRFTNSRSR